MGPSRNVAPVGAWVLAEVISVALRTLLKLSGASLALRLCLSHLLAGWFVAIALDAPAEVAALRVVALASVILVASLRERPLQIAAYVFAAWLAVRVASTALADMPLVDVMAVAGLLALAIMAVVVRSLFAALAIYRRQRDLGIALSVGLDGIDPVTGFFEERLLPLALESELARARRFSRRFAFVLVGTRPIDLDTRRRDSESWRRSYLATARLLSSTRLLVDRIYLHGHLGFAMVLPEASPREVMGLIRRLRQMAARADPPEGQPGGPFPVTFGVTFYPDSASTVEGLLARAAIALRLAGHSPSRFHLDGAATPRLDPRSLRADEADQPVINAT